MAYRVVIIGAGFGGTGMAIALSALAQAAWFTGTVTASRPGCGQVVLRAASS